MTPMTDKLQFRFTITRIEERREILRARKRGQETEFEHGSTLWWVTLEPGSISIGLLEKPPYAVGDTLILTSP